MNRDGDKLRKLTFSREGNFTPTWSPDGKRILYESVPLNNDLSGGVPDILKNLEQEVYPPLSAGWHMRRKSQHFAAYDRVADEFAQLIGIDPWLINPYFAVCNQVNFQERVGEACLAVQVDGVLQKMRAKYAGSRYPTAVATPATVAPGTPSSSLARSIRASIR